MLNLFQDSHRCLLSWDEWRLEFLWQDDRWSHALWQESDGQRRDHLTSLEGTTEQSWPSSPAFQDLLTERINANCCEIQLLGQAGKNHYSGAIRCDAARNVIDFDLAVRIQTLPTAPLTLSTYVRANETHSDPASSWNIDPEVIPKFPELKCSTEGSGLETLPRIRLFFEDLESLKFEKQRATIRWKYQLTR